MPEVTWNGNSLAENKLTDHDGHRLGGIVLGKPWKCLTRARYNPPYSFGAVERSVPEGDAAVGVIGVVYPISASRLKLDVQRHTALLEMADVLSRHHEPSDLFRGLAPSLRAVVPFDFLNFALHEPSVQLMKLHVWNGEDWPATPREIAVDEAAVGWVWEHQQPLTVDDLERESRFERGLAYLRDHQVRSYCVAPLTSSQTKLGALGFGSRRPHAFS